MHAQTAAVALFACAPDVVVLAHAAAVAVYACAPDVLVLADVAAAADHVPRDTSKRAKRPTHLTSKKRKPVARPNTMGAACVDDESDDAGEGVGLWFDVVMLLVFASSRASDSFFSPCSCARFGFERMVYTWCRGRATLSCRCCNGE